jgi:hypothetical protein
MISRKLLVIWYMLLVVAVGVVSAIAITTIFEHQNSVYSVFPEETIQSNAPAAPSNSVTSSFVGVQEPEKTIRVTHSSSSGSSTSSSSDSSQNAQTNPPAQDNIQQTVSQECLDKYGLDAHTIIFYYSNEPHSNAMKPIVSELESVYSFYWTNSLWDEEFNSCFGTTGVTPAFVCSGTAENLLGEIPKSMLESFAARCT